VPHTQVLDPVRLSRWLASHDLLSGGGELQATPLAGGSQHALYLLRRGDSELILRALPSHAGPERAQALMREYRHVRALAGTDVPHAKAHAATDDPAVAGQPCYVMDRVDGWSPAGQAWPAPFDTDPGTRAGLAFQLVEGIARLASVEWRERGLEGFGRPGGFHERQVDRWLSFLAAYQFRELPGLDEAAAWLRSHRPRTYQPGIMHGDYQWANVMFAYGAPARLAAIVDWEMATIGDPLLDLGWALLAWGPEGDDMTAARLIDHAGMPPRDDLLDHYQAVSGRPVDDIDYYVILARFKFGIVLEKTVARSRNRAGGPADPAAERFDPVILEVIRKAAELARHATLA
jgi:aminoglycoside phosphotransferase (APT) family kinase protein